VSNEVSNATLCEMFTSRSATGIDAVPPSIVDALDPLSDALASCVLASFRRDGRPVATGVLGRALLVVDDAESVVRDKLLDEGLEFLAPNGSRPGRVGLGSEPLVGEHCRRLRC